MTSTFKRIAAVSILAGLCTPALALSVILKDSLSTCQPVQPYTYQNGALVCSGTVTATGQRFLLSFKVSGGTTVTGVKYVFAARLPLTTFFKTETGSLLQATPGVNDYTLKVSGPAVNAAGVVLKDAAGNPYQFSAEQHFQLVTPQGITGAGAPQFAPLNLLGPTESNFVGY
jgi:hypothetical protein